MTGTSLECELSTTQLHSCLEDPRLLSMNFLSEVSYRYPNAVTFASGRPSEIFFDDGVIEQWLARFRRYLHEDLAQSTEQIRRTVLQYGPTKGIITRLVADNLRLDENIAADPESIVVTVGCQEALFLVLRALRADETDVLLAVAPTYVGLTGAARLVDLPVLPVSSGITGVDLWDLAVQVRRARERGQRPRACYVVPDFANPSGMQMDPAVRRDLLELAEQEGILIIEDNPYGLFHGGAERLPTLKALDADRRRVIYLGTFAKTVVPGSRVGYVVADQRVQDRSGETTLFADQLAKIKSMVTVNTSSIAQAVVGGALLAFDGSLVNASRELHREYTNNLHRMLAGLEERMPRTDPRWSGVSWNSPTGGFFVVLTVPFAADNDAITESAERFGVLWTPMHHFYENGGMHQMRLSCSVLRGEEIDLGLDRLVSFIAPRL